MIRVQKHHGLEVQISVVGSERHTLIHRQGNNPIRMHAETEKAQRARFFGTENEATIEIFLQASRNPEPAAVSACVIALPFFFLL